MQIRKGTGRQHEQLDQMSERTYVFKQKVWNHMPVLQYRDGDQRETGDRTDRDRGGRVAVLTGRESGVRMDCLCIGSKEGQRLQDYGRQELCGKGG